MTAYTVQLTSSPAHADPRQSSGELFSTSAEQLTCDELYLWAEKRLQQGNETVFSVTIKPGSSYFSELIEPVRHGSLYLPGFWYRKTTVRHQARVPRAGFRKTGSRHRFREYMTTRYRLLP